MGAHFHGDSQMDGGDLQLLKQLRETPSAMNTTLSGAGNQGTQENEKRAVVSSPERLGWN